MTRALAILSVLLLASCDRAHSVISKPLGFPPGMTIPADPAEPVVIINSTGGNVAQWVNYRDALAKAGNPVYLRGYNRSATTILYSLPGACVGIKGALGFHGSSGPEVPVAGAITNSITDQVIGSYYRAGIKAKWEAEWQHSRVTTRIEAAEVIQLDPSVRYCPV